MSAWGRRSPGFARRRSSLRGLPCRRPPVRQTQGDETAGCPRAPWLPASGLPEPRSASAGQPRGPAGHTVGAADSSRNSPGHHSAEPKVGQWQGAEGGCTNQGFRKKQNQKKMRVCLHARQPASWTSVGAEVSVQVQRQEKADVPAEGSQAGRVSRTQESQPFLFYLSRQLIG